MDILREICEYKRRELDIQKQKVPEQSLHYQLEQAPPLRHFTKEIRKKVENRKVALIAEIKQASPSQGLICNDFSPLVFAREYAKGGATCLSVLTDAHYFKGDGAHISQARSVCGLPILRKDFIIDPYQVIESRVLGADCILLIMSVLSDEQAVELESLALELGMDVLVEVHNAKEMQRAQMNLKSPLLGINNRNLKTMKVDLARTEELAPMVGMEHIAVCESGIGTHEEVAKIVDLGVFTFLVGGGLLSKSSDNLAEATQTLLGGLG